MIDLFPEEIISGLVARFGTRFTALSHVERVALALAASEGTVSHSRLRAVSIEHPVDLSRTLQYLRQVGMLESSGGRGAIYHLPGEAIPTPDDIFGPFNRFSGAGSPLVEPSSSVLGVSSSVLGVSSSVLDANSLVFASENGVRDEFGRILSEKLDMPLVDEIDKISPLLHGKLTAIAELPRRKGKLPRNLMAAVLLELCRDQFICLRCLAELVERKPEALRNEYLTPLVRGGQLVLAFPKTPTHERQAYGTNSSFDSLDQAGKPDQ